MRHHSCLLPTSCFSMNDRVPPYSLVIDRTRAEQTLTCREFANLDRILHTLSFKVACVTCYIVHNIIISYVIIINH